MYISIFVSQGLTLCYEFDFGECVPHKANLYFLLITWCDDANNNTTIRSRVQVLAYTPVSYTFKM